MERHEVMCDRCEKISALSWDREQWVVPDEWYSFNGYTIHLCKRCFKRAIEKEPKAAPARAQE